MTPPRRACVALLLALLPCVPLAAQEWHEDYRNGVRALAQGHGARAVALLQQAVHKRPQPGINVVTYGTNVEPSYFPYLRLAEAHLMTGRIDAAREALKVSEQYGIEPPDARAELRARVDEAALASARARATPLPAPSPSPSPPPPPPSPSPTPLPAAGMPPAAPSPVAVPVSTPVPAPREAASAPPPRQPQPTAAPRAPAGMAAPQPSPPAQVAAPPTAATPTAVPPVADSHAALELISTPPNAEVYLDDERAGVTDPESGRLLASGLSAGRHRLRVSRRGHADHISEVDLSRGRTHTYRVTLAPQDEPAPAPPFALLALAGVIVAAGVGVFMWLRSGRAGRDTSWLGRLTGRARTSPPAHAAARATPGATPLPPGGELFGEYLLVDILGRGGMATVYQAERRVESVALKRPLAHFLGEPEFMARFLREAEIGLTLHHPNIVRIFERGEVAGVPYFTMELLPGRTLQSWLRHGSGVVAPRRAVEIVAGVAEALDYAHLKGVIHRDLKPSNIMLSPEGAVRVMDYGIARARRFDGLTVTGAFLGTPDYVAPETIEGRGSTPRSDLYALGVVFYELLCGRRPFEADSPFGILRQHCTEPPPTPSSRRAGVPPELDAIVLRLLAKDATERYDAEGLLVALRQWLNRAG